jgi:cytidine deaminase
MKEVKITATYQVFENKKELPKEIISLFKKAEKARDNAYAPYSNFQVGAAILFENGQIVTGSNQENAAYPSGMCAERVAIYHAGSQYPNLKIKALVITAKSKTKTVDKPVGPCGACRQSIAEYEMKQEKDIQIYFMGEVGKIVKSNSLKDLLPLSFDKSFL